MAVLLNRRGAPSGSSEQLWLRPEEAVEEAPPRGRDNLIDTPELVRHRRAGALPHAFGGADDAVRVFAVARPEPLPFPFGFARDTVGALPVLHAVVHPPVQLPEDRV